MAPAPEGLWRASDCGISADLRVLVAEVSPEGGGVSLGVSTHLLAGLGRRLRLRLGQSQVAATAVVVAVAAPCQRDTPACWAGRSS